MLLNEFQSSSSKKLHRLIQEHFNYKMPMQQLTIEKSEKILSLTTTKLLELKNSDKFFESHNSSTYCWLLATRDYMMQWLVEADAPDNPEALANARIAANALANARIATNARVVQAHRAHVVGALRNIPKTMYQAAKGAIRGKTRPEGHGKYSPKKQLPTAVKNFSDNLDKSNIVDSIEAGADEQTPTSAAEYMVRAHFIQWAITQPELIQLNIKSVALEKIADALFKTFLDAKKLETSNDDDLKNRIITYLKIPVEDADKLLPFFKFMRDKGLQGQ